MSERATILVICTGNFCRSPMAVAILENLLQQDRRDPVIHALSAGTWTRDGIAASPLAMEVMEERGLDISAHRSHHLSRQDVEQAALIVTMTRDHKEALLAEFPAAGKKTFLLSELAGENHDVADPYGSDSLTEYRLCASEMSRLLRKSYPRLLELATTNKAGDSDLKSSEDARDASTSPSRSRPSAR